MRGLIRDMKKPPDENSLRAVQIDIELASVGTCLGFRVSGYTSLQQKSLRTFPHPPPSQEELKLDP